MAADAMLDYVKHYQHKIEREGSNEKQILDSIHKLYKLPVTVQLLQDTGVGRTVNALRKGEGDVAAAARALVAKWKLMVAREERESERLQQQKAASENEEYSSSPENSDSREEQQEYSSHQNQDDRSRKRAEEYQKELERRRIRQEIEHGHENLRRSDASEYHKNEKKRKRDIETYKQRKMKKYESSEGSQDEDSNGSTSDDSNEDNKETVINNSNNSDLENVKSETKTESEDEQDSSQTSDNEDNNNGVQCANNPSTDEQSESKNSESSSNESEPEVKKVHTKHHHSYKHTSSKSTLSSEKHSHRESKYEKHQSSSYDHKSSKSTSSDKSFEKMKIPTEKHSSSQERNDEKTPKEKNTNDSSHKSKYKDKDKSRSNHKDKHSDKEKRKHHDKDKSKHSSREKHSEKTSEFKEKKSESKDRDKKSESRDRDKKSESKNKDKNSDTSKAQLELKEVKMDTKDIKVESKDKNSKSDSKDKGYHLGKHKHESSKHKSHKESSSKTEKESSSKKGAERESSESKRKEHRSDSKKDSSSSSKHCSTSKHSSSKPKSKEVSNEYVPEAKKRKILEDSANGIDAESGASFAEALGMISPSKSSLILKKKSSSSTNQRPLGLPDSDNVHDSKSSFDELTPSLLKPSTKLAPLPPLKVSVSALPDISPNYVPRPAPRLPDVPLITEEEAMSVVMNTKNQRTKVYSGNKATHGKVPSLYDLCVYVLQENISALEFTGGVPYDLIKPVIIRSTPDQLYALEDFNPYLIEDTDELWKEHCSKRFKHQVRNEFESWREMYLRCVDEQEAKLKSLTANIKKAQDKSQPVRQLKMAYVDSIVKPPRQIARKQAIYGTARKPAASPAARVPSLSNNQVFNASTAVGVGASAASTSRPVSTCNTKQKRAPMMAKLMQSISRGRGKR